MSNKALFGLAVFSSVLSGACGVSGDLYVEMGEGELGQPVTWEEFSAGVYREPTNGVYLVDGDTPVEDLKQLREFYEVHVLSGQLAVYRSGGSDVRWSNTQKRNLTYCVSTNFGTRHGQVVQALNDAAASWEAAADIDFIHLAAQDGSCTASNSSVLFDVRPVNVNGEYMAMAFFPNQGRSTRNVLIDGSAFSSGQTVLTGVLRHELGHALGFRHEHTRPEAGACFEDSQWRALTPYDSSSAMHYPQCNGTNNWTLPLTAYDISGAASLYGAPGTTQPPPSGQSTQTFSGSLSQGQSRSHGPIAVAPGSLFEVEMTGTGDPDLYVRFDSAPTLSAYDCRPYLTGATERCSLTVPSSRSMAYITVRGYSAGSYKLVVRYTPGQPGPSGTSRTARYTGTVAQGAQNYHGPLSVVAGTTFQVVMSGSGDPDLYVRFGSQPTTSAYDCRPYLDGPAESCLVTVPSGASSAYLMVRGYAAATYALDVAYTGP
ncbi:MAG: matrixin family metalloprotease [Myxococcales bacterium]|nr:matrixin family metalloprotease [Myxococcales bacterium]